jgi:Flp pilus assembly protein TadG
MTLSPRHKMGQVGTAVVEVALLLPLLTSLLLAIIGGSLLMNTIGSLHYAVEGAARCAGINAASCTTTTATQSYAASLYTGPSSPAPVFTASAQTCGNQVSGSITYVLDVAVAEWTIPLSATACFP